MNKRSDKMMYNILTDSYSSIEDMILSEIVMKMEEWGENPLFFSVKGSIIGEKSVKFLYHSFYGFCLDSDGEEYISSNPYNKNLFAKASACCFPYSVKESGLYMG